VKRVDTARKIDNIKRSIHWRRTQVKLQEIAERQFAAGKVFRDMMAETLSALRS